LEILDTIFKTHWHLTLYVPDVEYTLHENAFLHYVRKRNHKWVKLKSY